MGKKKVKIFGTPLRQLCESLGQAIPEIVRASVTYLTKNLDTEGLFRNRPDEKRLQSLVEKWDQGKGDPEKQFTDPHLVAFLLMQWLQRLPEPVLTAGQYDGFLDAHALMDSQDRLVAIHQQIALLPPENQVLLAFLLKFLNDVIQHSDQNRVSLQDFAFKIGPILLGRERKPQDRIRCYLMSLMFIKQYDVVLKLKRPELPPPKRTSKPAKPLDIPAEQKKAAAEAPAEGDDKGGKRRSVSFQSSSAASGSSSSSSGSSSSKGKKDEKKADEQPDEVIAGDGGGDYVVRTITMKCLYTFVARHDWELTITVGDTVRVISEEDDGWWHGEVGDESGLFPYNYCEPLIVERAEKRDETKLFVKRKSVKLNIMALQDKLMKSMAKKAEDANEEDDDEEGDDAEAGDGADDDGEGKGDD